MERDALEGGITKRCRSCLLDGSKLKKIQGSRYRMYPYVIQWITQETGERCESSRPTRSGGQSVTALTNARSAKARFTIGPQWD